MTWGADARGQRFGYRIRIAMIGSLIFLNSRGDIILSRAFRDNVNMYAIFIFIFASTHRSDAPWARLFVRRLLLRSWQTGCTMPTLLLHFGYHRSPVKTLGSVSFLHMRHENLYIVATSRANVNVALIFTFMSRTGLVKILFWSESQTPCFRGLD